MRNGEEMSIIKWEVPMPANIFFESDFVSYICPLCNKLIELQEVSAQKAIVVGEMPRDFMTHVACLEDFKVREGKEWIPQGAA